MKTGVVTFHIAHNYGATLQAWALQKAIKKLGVTPCIVNYHPEVIDRLYTVPRLDTWAKRMQYLKKREVRARRRKLKIKYTRYQRFLREHFELVGDYTIYEELISNPPDTCGIGYPPAALFCKFQKIGWVKSPRMVGVPDLVAPHNIAVKSRRV